MNDNAKVVRKLATIVSADVAGYSRLMSSDEAATVSALNGARAIFKNHAGEHGGRIVDTAGDSVLAEFQSPVEAVVAAVEIQKTMAGLNAVLPEHRRMRFRMGVNLDDVIEDDDALYGDGVNIAVRIQELSRPGGLCVSGTVFDHVEGRLPLAFQSLGARRVKGIPKSIRVYCTNLEGSSKQGAASLRPHKNQSLILAMCIVLAGAGLTGWLLMRMPATSLTTAILPVLPEGPSIAVLPFQNIGGKPGEEWFSDGITETLITDLSRLDKIFVVGRNSTFSYKNKAADLRQIGRELGVRHVLEGSVQQTDARLRVNVQLVEAESGRHIWAERYDRPSADLFDIQDDITQRIVTELDVRLLQGEQARAWRKTTRNRQAYEFYLQGLAHARKYTREDWARAQVLHQQAIDLDPGFSRAIVALAWTHYHQGDSGWSSNPRESYGKAVALGHKAIAVDPSLGDAYVLLANSLATLEKHAEAVSAADKALAVSPNQADVLVNAGWVLAGNGRAQEAIALVERAIRLNPVPPDWYYGALGDALLFANRIDEALSAHRKCAERLPEFIYCQLGLTVTYIEVGDLERARMRAQIALRINPSISAKDNTFSRNMGVVKTRNQVVADFRRAGLR